MLRKDAPNARRPKPALLGLVLLGLVGCSGQQTAEVTGKVTVGDKPATSGKITFVHNDGRTAVALIGLDGTYRAEGVPVGTLKVGIEGFRPPSIAAKTNPKVKGIGKMKDPNDPNAPAGPVLDPTTFTSGPTISRRYSDPKGSGLTAEVKDGTQNKIDFPLKAGGL